MDILPNDPLTIIDGGAYNTAANGIQITTCSGNDLDLIQFTSTTTPEDIKIGSTTYKTSDLVSTNKASAYEMNQIYCSVARLKPLLRLCFSFYP